MLATMGRKKQGKTKKEKIISLSVVQTMKQKN